MATAKKTPAKKKPVARKTKVDWLEVRKEYLTDATSSYRSLAKKYGVSKETLQKRATGEGWTELRQDLADKAFNNFTQKLLDTKSEAQNRHLQHYQNIQALVNKSIQEMADGRYFTVKGQLVLDKKNKPIPIPLDPFKLEKLAKAAKDAINGERVVLGLPTSVSALTDAEGGNVWGGFSDMVKEAERVLKENGEAASGSDT